MAQIEDSIKYLNAYRNSHYNDSLTEDSYWMANAINDILPVAVRALRRPSPSPAPLTLEHGFDITNADGTPIDYDALGRKYKDKLCYCDIDGFYIGEDGQLVLMDDCGASVSVDRGDYHILARKPAEGE